MTQLSSVALLVIAAALVPVGGVFSRRVDDGGPVFFGDPLAIDCFHANGLAAGFAGVDSPSCPGSTIAE